MSSVAVLLGLLVVAYVGSHLMGGRGKGLRFASGAEYLLLGAALGPYALGAVDRSTLLSFQPLAVIGTAWITLVIGVGYGDNEGQRISLRGMVAGLLLAALSGASAGFSAYLFLSRVTALTSEELLLVAGGAGLVACETTRYAVRWVTGRHGAEGPLSLLITEMSESDDLIPILGIAVLFPLIDPPPVASRLPLWGWLALTPVLGVLLGGTAAALLRAEPRASEGWGVIIGAALLGTGIASRLGLSPQAVTFCIGLSLSLSSRHRRDLRTMLSRSERAVLLPILILTGAETEVKNVGIALGIFGIVLVARFAARLVSAPILATLSGAPKSVVPALALGLMPSGALSVTLGLALESRFRGIAGNAVLSLAFGLSVAGEIAGPVGLRRALARAGELKPPRDGTNGAAPSADAVPEAVR
jgi:hypothetical protein